MRVPPIATSSHRVRAGLAVACGSHATPGRDDRETPMTSSVLSYFEEYFTPDGDAPLSGHSTGQIARHIHSLLDRRGTWPYRSQQTGGWLPPGVSVGSFWSVLY